MKSWELFATCSFKPNVEIIMHFKAEDFEAAAIKATEEVPSDYKIHSLCELENEND